MSTDDKNELMAQGLAQGMTEIAAYAHAGYKPDDGNASRKANEPEIVARVAELKAAAAERAGVNLDAMGAQLDEDRHFARLMGNPSAAVAATMGKAKLYGLLKDRIEHSGEIDITAMTALQAARRIAFALEKAKRILDEQKAGHG